MLIEKADRVDSLLSIIQKLFQSEEVQRVLHSRLMSRSLETITDLEELAQKSAHDPSYIPILLGRIQSILRRRPPDEPARRRRRDK